MQWGHNGLNPLKEEEGGGWGGWVAFYFREEKALVWRCVCVCDVMHSSERQHNTKGRQYVDIYKAFEKLLMQEGGTCCKPPR